MVNIYLGATDCLWMESVGLCFAWAMNQAVYEAPDTTTEGNWLETSVKLAEVANAIGKTVSEFEESLPALLKLGFPQPDEETGDYVAEQVLDWVGVHQTLILDLLTMVTAILKSLD